MILQALPSTTTDAVRSMTRLCPDQVGSGSVCPSLSRSLVKGGSSRSWTRGCQMESDS